jgi:hypothetical protein
VQVGTDAREQIDQIEVGRQYEFATRRSEQQ